jgi:hypothetical protein
MGAWGPAIFSDDTAADVRDEFKTLVGNGLDPVEATERLLSEWADVVEDPDDGPVFWLALAATQARLGRLVDEVRDRALAVIDSGENLRRWEEEASSADAAKRRRHLTKLRADLVGEPKADSGHRIIPVGGHRSPR